MTNQKTIYDAGGWFNSVQRKLLSDGREALIANPTVDFNNSYVPLEHQYKGLNVELNPELMQDQEWQAGTYLGDVSGISGTDLVVAFIDPDEVDPGTTFEMGYGMAIHKPVVVVIPDKPEGEVTELNLMVAKGCTQVITMSELAAFNFNLIPAKPYLGKVF